MLLLAGVGVLAACTTRPAQETEIRPGPDFPATASHYPRAALYVAQEGPVTLQVCVDTQGKLQESPSVLTSSGSSALDDAALRLARAGNGRYLPVERKGAPVKACGRFVVNFSLPVDPRWPTLWRRLSKVTGSFQSQLDEWGKIPVSSGGFDLSSPEKRQLQRRALQEQRRHIQGIAETVAGYLAGLDRLETDPAIPEAERAGFQADSVWTSRRHELQTRTQAFVTTGQAALDCLVELLDFSEHHLAQIVATKPLPPQEQQQLNTLLARSQAASGRFQAAERDLRMLFVQP